MRKALPMSALITGLLAGPGMGVAPPVRAATALVGGQAGAFPAVMPAEVATELRRLARGEKPNTYGMQDLQQRLAAEVQQRLAQVLERREELYPVQLIVPASALQPRMEKAAFMGVATSPVPAVVRDQLKLPRGEGLVVDYVEKDSPAEAAGVKVHDVLEKLDDQVLINGQQLAVLVRDKKPGETVKLTVLHEGQRQAVNVKLVEREVAVLEDLMDPSVAGRVAANPPQQGITVWPDTLPPLVPQSIVGSNIRINGDGSIMRRRVDEGNDITVTRAADGKETLSVKDREGHVLYEGPGEGLEKANLPAEVVKKVDELRQGPAAIPVPGNAGGGGVGTAIKTFTANRKDDTHDITLRSDNGDRHVTVKEIGGGKVIFDGPINTDEQMKALPAGVREKVQVMLEKMK